MGYVMQMKNTFATIFIPGVDTVLYSIADQGVVDTHVAMAEKQVSFTRSWKEIKSSDGL